MKKTADESDQILRQMAFWYYKRNMTQAEIAQRLGMSRQKVNRLIGQLEALGIVEIRIHGLVDDLLELEGQIEKRFGLGRVFVIDTHGEGRSRFGEKAAEAVVSLLQDGQSIGVSWGETLGETIAKLPQLKLENCTVLQLVGGLNSENKQTKSDEITRALAQKLGGDYQILYTPAIVESDEVRQVLLREASIAAMFQRLGSCDMALLGVGELRDTATIYKQGYIDDRTLGRMQADGCVGDLAMQPFDIEGNFKSYHSVMGVTPQMLERIPNVVVLACGARKVKAVLGAINTGVVDTLIVDKTIAKQISTQ